MRIRRRGRVRCRKNIGFETKAWNWLLMDLGIAGDLWDTWVYGCIYDLTLIIIIYFWTTHPHGKNNATSFRRAEDGIHHVALGIRSQNRTSDLYKLQNTSSRENSLAERQSIHHKTLTSLRPQHEDKIPRSDILALLAADHLLHTLTRKSREP